MGDTASYIFVAGHRGSVDSATFMGLTIIGCERVCAEPAKLNLRDQREVAEFMNGERPDDIFVAAAGVGSIQANDICRAASSSMSKT